MMWWLVAFASAGLIALGCGLLIRDIFFSRTANDKRSAVESPASQPMASTLASAIPQRAGEAVGLATHGAAPIVKRPAALEKKWSRLRKEVDAAVSSVNQSMQRLSIAVGAPGQATWSLEHEGYGDYRRVRIEQESVAWLRLEVTPDLRIRSRLRTHDAQFSDLNRDAEAAADRSGTDLAQAITDSLSAIFDFAVKRHSDLLRQETAATSAPRTSPTLHASGTPEVNVTLRRTREQAPMSAEPVAQTPPVPASMPSPSAALVDAAVSLVNRAFAEANAVLIPTDDGRTTKAFSDRTLSIVSGRTPVGLMVIEPRSDRIDISVGMLDQGIPQSLRKKSQPLSGLTVHTLAEAIATNAWPPIAAASAQSVVA